MCMHYLVKAPLSKMMNKHIPRGGGRDLDPRGCDGVCSAMPTSKISSEAIKFHEDRTSLRHGGWRTTCYALLAPPEPAIPKNIGICWLFTSGLSISAYHVSNALFHRFKGWFQPEEVSLPLFVVHVQVQVLQPFASSNTPLKCNILCQSFGPITCCSIFSNSIFRESKSAFLSWSVWYCLS